VRHVDRFDLYELTVQSPSRLVPFLRAIHGREPRVLGEDFAGTAVVSRAWVGLVDKGRAIAVDHDAEALSRASERDGVHAIVGDVRTATSAASDSADVIFVGNFSIGELHERTELVRYLRHARARMNANGIFVCDTYGGASAFRTGAVERSHYTPDGARIRYTWQQRRADPLTGEVENALHFRVERAGEIVQEITDAFVYHWRLWSLPELRDALAEAGFGASEVYSELADEPNGAVVHARTALDEHDAGETFILCVVGRA
jgi:hypothetical protein